MQVQLLGEILFLGELQTVFAAVFRVAGILYPVRCTAKHERATGRGEEDILPEQPAGYRLRGEKAAKRQSFRNCFELRIGDRSQTLRVYFCLAHRGSVRSWRCGRHRRNDVSSL